MESAFSGDLLVKSQFLHECKNENDKKGALAVADTDFCWVVASMLVLSRGCSRVLTGLDMAIVSQALDLF